MGKSPNDPRYPNGWHMNDRMPHHDSFEQLWETKWKDPCSKGIYPFMFGSIDDFQPTAEHIIAKGLKEPYNWDEYASCFFGTAEKLGQTAAVAQQEGDTDKARDFYLRASAVYRIARFPAPRSPLQHQAWKNGKEMFYAGAKLMEYPIHEVLIPHTHALANSSEQNSFIPVNLLIPPSSSSSSPSSSGYPLVIIMTGLDGYRTELAVWQRGFLDKGVATLVVEIPGTGDSPALASDPQSADRQWSSVLDFVAKEKHEEIDSTKIIVWGFSTGGYYALRAAHTHHDRLLGSISLGGGCHHMFDEEWLDKVNNLEYPFDLADTLAYKFGYGSDGVEQFKKEGQVKFSLLLDGTLMGQCCRCLVVNGEWDRIFPVEDLALALKWGRPKEARIVREKWHMGEPESFVVILRWIHELLGLDGDYMHHLKLLGGKTK
ncbi:conidial pigment biosynthesis protein Ayg1 [Neurospora crassa OR74A]|uniref:Conidial pigment biosynthesis protein Ayg1 n=1 Tax=Neurospora crassa (strain ATCC 24698 / 74-OR23-1A / CBS 708.71 / DSM 1257 / FGSC 987) TaxID=367110 RepID=Q7S5M2_NEUCR|nr:conidial pigment biosynthesis protein Ayg1 [Neurospora crassa OR74A]EAA30845.1 conidial pigment biosynthesis protein Ayg1 [Neurospora crassa OR74A]|eukprot:XP_960081.1 conidial pigment biosynthesis protein Ayg1 [Neurospora crassa OR74A]